MACASKQQNFLDHSLSWPLRIYIVLFFRKLSAIPYFHPEGGGTPSHCMHRILFNTPFLPYCLHYSIFKTGNKRRKDASSSLIIYIFLWFPQNCSKSVFFPFAIHMLFSFQFFQQPLRNKKEKKSASTHRPVCFTRIKYLPG